MNCAPLALAGGALFFRSIFRLEARSEELHKDPEDRFPVGMFCFQRGIGCDWNCF